MALFAPIVERLVKGTPLSYPEGDQNFRYLQLAGHPIGAVTIYAANADLPASWLECNGAVLPNATYPELYSVIGTAFGGDVDNFNLPETRGLFVRGWNNGALNDPEPGGRIFGSYQWDTMASHAHDSVLSDNATLAGSEGTVPTTWTDNPGSPNVPTAPFGNDETRPRNIAMMYIIKATYE